MPDVVRALAKLTLSLRVTGRRRDGYHLIDAEMVTIDLADTLELGPGHGLEIVDERAPAAAAEGPDLLALGDGNLISRALVAVQRQAHVRLVKRIPVGAGLGGGSADAAAVLRWAGADDLALAARLGADVPFCLVGGRARVTGAGEVVEPLDPRPQTFTVLSPPLHVPTLEVYRAWDELGGPAGAGPNDLEPAALAVEPRLARWRDRLADATGRVPALAGSGGTWFVEGAFPAAGVVVQTAQP
ncbi:MAG TPA: 4-(cytidine 5'-diphospho)-2-C-methyl-D-erythritol kinase [Acidimicrobiales bacterium]